MASKITYSHCLCCGSAAINKVFECKDHAVSKEYFEIWKCNTCTFRFTQNVPDADTIGMYYRSANYVSHTDTKSGLVNRLYHLARGYTLTTKLNLVEEVTGLKHGALLDVGAGTGAFASKMRKAGWNVTGLEPDESARANAFKKYRLQLEEQNKLNDLPENCFDAITLWHVLEHVHDLEGYLEKFLQILRPEGRLLIAVPNHISYDARVYRQYWAAYDVPRHLYHFSPQSMQKLLERKGYVIQAFKPMWLDSFYVSMLSERYWYGKDRIINAIWRGIVSNAIAVLSRKKCSSIIYVVRKK